MPSSPKKNDLKGIHRISAKTDNPADQDRQLRNRLEFHRHAVALMPTVDDGDSAVAYEVQNSQGRVGSRACSCKASATAGI
jgi:hypothetical protein